MALERGLGLHDAYIARHATFSSLFAIVAFALYWLALKEKRRVHYQGEMRFSQGFSCGVIITLIVTLFTPVSQYVVSEFITPHYFDNMIAYVVEQKTMSADAAQSYFSLPNYILQSLIMAPVMGVLTSLLVAFVMRTKTKVSEIDTDGAAP